MRSRRLLALAAVLFLVRACFCFWGYDRRPLITSNDEAIVQDAAVALSRGEGLRAVSFGDLEIAGLYANHPPLSLFVQAGVFRLFGVSPATLRVPGILENLLGVALLLWMLRQGVRTGFMDRFGALAAGALLLCDPFILILSRIGRMEHLAALLGLAGLAAALPAAFSPVAGGVLMGLAVATHPAAVLYLFPFYGLVFLRRKELGWKKSLLVFALPPLAFLAVWGLGFGGRSVEAFRQMASLAKISLPPTLGLAALTNAVVHRDAEAFKGLGATAYLLVVGGWVFLAARLALPARNPGSAWRRGLPLLAFAALLQAAAAYKLSFYSSRTMLYAPLGVFNLALGLSFLPDAARRVAGAGVALFLCADLGLGASYFAALSKHWAEWSPDRFAPLVSSIPEGAKVASTFELWHEWMGRGRTIRVIDPSIPIDRSYWHDDPARFADYDVLIFSSRTEAERAAALGTGLFAPPAWSEETHRLDEATYSVYRKRVTLPPAPR